MEYLTLALLIAAVIIAVVYIAKTGSTSDSNNKLRELKQAYEKTLASNNKRAALDAGRAYYSAWRENKTLTVYDEQAIANDLSAMVIQPEDIQGITSPQL